MAAAFWLAWRMLDASMFWEKARNNATIPPEQGQRRLVVLQPV